MLAFRTLAIKPLLIHRLNYRNHSEFTEFRLIPVTRAYFGILIFERQVSIDKSLQYNVQYKSTTLYFENYQIWQLLYI